MKCEAPARSARSSRAPAPIQKPSATERTDETRSEMTRSPESSSDRTYFCTTGSYKRPRNPPPLHTLLGMHSATEDLNRSALSATVHCLTGCAIGEVLGMVIATALDWSNAPSIAISVALAFLFGYSLTLGPVLRAQVPFRRALPLALASDTASITVMEIVDNAFILLVPGAMEAGLADGLFWW